MNPDQNFIRAQVGSPAPTHDTSTGGVPAAVHPSNPGEAAALASKNLSNYREAVESLLRLRSDEPIANSEPAHAAILFEKFFEHAHDHVRIFCTRLNPEVFGNPSVVEQARRAVAKRRVRVSVITQDEPRPSEFLNFLRNDNPNVKIVVACDPRTKELPANFAVMDGRAIRYETDRTKCEATAVMNDPNLAGSWSRYFDEILLTEESERPTRGELTPT